MSHVCTVCVCVHTYGYVPVPEEAKGIGSPGAGVGGICGLSDVGAGN